MNPFVDALLKDAFVLMKYDPNYMYNDGDEEMKDEEQADEDGAWGSDFSEDDAAAMMDDDDTSWKVRRGANSIVNSILRTRRDLVSQIHAKYCISLVSCFKERIDDVKIDILDTFMQILASSDP